MPVLADVIARSTDVVVNCRLMLWPWADVIAHLG